MLPEGTARKADDAPPGEGNADAHDAGAPVGMQPGERPGDRCAPVVADHHGLLLAIGIDHADDVTDQFFDAIGRLGPELGGSPIAALVDRHHPVTRVGEHGNLMTPGVPGFGEPVHQHHQGPLALFHGMDAGPPAVEHPMKLRHRGHLSSGSVYVYQTN
mgnify:CR=1 FL=1